MSPQQKIAAGASFSPEELRRWHSDLIAREKALLHRESLLDRPELTLEDVRESARVAALEVLVRMGVDAEDPIEMQKDFQHVRSWRIATEKAKERTMLAMLGIIITGALGALWLGIKSSITH